MTQPTFDKDGYPTDEALDYIAKWEWNLAAFPEFLAFVRHAWNEGYGAILDEDYAREPVLKFITGGWSGNESVIGALKENRVLWALLWESSTRGGLHILSMPKLA